MVLRNGAAVIREDILSFLIIKAEFLQGVVHCCVAAAGGRHKSDTVFFELMNGYDIFFGNCEVQVD